jgi:hypothetical protein
MASCSRHCALLRRPGPCGLQLREERPRGDPARAAPDPDARQLAALDQAIDRLCIQLEQFGHLRRRQEGASTYVGRGVHKLILYVVSAIQTSGELGTLCSRLLPLIADACHTLRQDGAR